MNHGHDSFRNKVKDFAQTEIAPIAAKIDQDNAMPLDLWRKLGEARLLGLTIPTRYGGSNLGYLEQLIANEEISRASASVGLSYAAHTIICVHNLYRHGTREQNLRYLPKLCRGEWVGALAMSEADAGSDITGSMQCRALKHGDHWIANGKKKWITNGPKAEILLVYMRTEEPPHKKPGLTAFIIERGMDGFESGKKTNKLGMRGSDTCELTFTNCMIPKENVLGAVDAGVSMMMQGLDSERLILSGGPLGIMQAALDLVLPHLHKRVQFGKPIGEFQLMQAKLANMYTRLQAARAFAYEVANAFDNTRAQRKDAAACYLFASEAAVQSALDAIQILGARGYMNDSAASRLLRDAKLYDIGGGTVEMRRLVIGRELFLESADSRNPSEIHHHVAA